MPITLATSPSRRADLVAEMLDERGIAYAVVYVEGFTEPHLQVGSEELVGLEEISNLLPDIERVASQ